MSIEDEEDKHFKILQQNELQELNEEKSKIAEEKERKAREQALAAEEAFLKVKKEREELAKAHEAIEHKVASIAEAEELKAANESLQRELEAIKAAQRANSSAALAAVASLDGKKGRRSSSRKSSASGGGSRVRSRSYERVSEKLANEMNDVSLDDGDDYHDGGSDSDDDDRKNRKPSSSSSRSRNKNSKSDMNYPKNGHVMHRGMPTAKCEICGLRIPFDEIEEHSEHCESAIPNNYAPENMNGSTCAIKSKGLLVTVLPSHSSADKFKISVFAGLDANGRTAEKASFKVERTKVKIEGLHNSLIRTLDNDETATDYDFDTSSRTQRLSTAFETASDLIGSFGSTLVGITAGFDSLTSSTTSAPTPQKTPPKNPQQRILDNSPNSIPDLPSLSMSDRSGLCRALERYLIALLELDEKWIELGNNNSFVGIHAMAEEGQVDPAPYIKAHRLLMAFLKDKARS
jgi:hypothetical protein